ncbi:hypothetical protein [Psychrobacillus sp. NPDC093180]
MAKGNQIQLKAIKSAKRATNPSAKATNPSTRAINAKSKSTFHAKA